MTSDGLISPATVANQFGSVAPGWPGQAPGSNLEYANFNALLLGGPTAATANQLIAVWLLDEPGGSLLPPTPAPTGHAGKLPPSPTRPLDANASAGIKRMPASFGLRVRTELKIPSVTASPGYLDLYMWEGDYSGYAQAALAGAAVGTTGVFVQPVVFGINPEIPGISIPDVLLHRFCPATPTATARSTSTT